MVYKTTVVHALVLMALVGGIRSYYIRDEEYPDTGASNAGVPMQDGDDYSFFVKEYPRRTREPTNYMKRAVMMGVDLPDFLLNRNHQTNKNLQALRQRLFESGRRR